MSSELIYTPVAEFPKEYLLEHSSSIEHHLSECDDLSPTDREQLLIQLEVLTVMTTSLNKMGNGSLAQGDFEE